jgi:L-ascorbate metabolism protein UlaG (beta-lactamase superfamily)
MDRLSYLGHSTTLIRVDGTALMTDPMLRGWLGPLRRQGPRPNPDGMKGLDGVLISHLHRDHLDLPSLRRIPASTPLIVPRGASRWLARSGAERVVELGQGESIPIGQLEVTAVPAVHDGRRDRWGRRIAPLGYVIEGQGRRIYFAGDTDLFPEMAELDGVDLALLPVWGWGTSVGAGHLDPRRAAEALRRIRPRLAIPIHWGTFFPVGLRRLRPRYLTDPPIEFARFAGVLAPEVEVRILQPGEETALARR